ncbi:MAG TPA: carbohydrate ABC transporter permease [Actinomycetes bacterium]
MAQTAATRAPARDRATVRGGTRGPSLLNRTTFYGGLILLTLVFDSPLLFMLSTSFKTDVESVSATPTWIPKEPTVEGYRTMFQTAQTPVLRWFVNSLLAAIGQTVLIVIVASLAAYALARMEFRGRRLLTGMILATLFIPPVSLLVPNYVIVSQLGWLDSLPAVIVPGAAAAFGVFFLRQFFISLPHELEEAALLDGANRWQIFYKVILPLSKPALATLALLSFLVNWNDFLWPLYVLFSPERLTLQPGLATLQSAFSTNYATIMVGGVIASVPVLIMYVIAQRFVIEGVSRSGLKG